MKDLSYSPVARAERSISPPGKQDDSERSEDALDEILDEPLTLSEAARLLPGKPHPSTLWRWRRKGVRGVKLRTLSVGGRPWVTRAAIADFLSAVRFATGLAS